MYVKENTKQGIIEALIEAGCEIGREVVEESDSNFYYKVRGSVKERVDCIKDINHFKAKSEICDIQEAFLLTSLQYGLRETRRYIIDFIKKQNLKFFARAHATSISNFKVYNHNLQFNRDLHFKFFLENTGEAGLFEGTNFIVTKIEDTDNALKIFVSIKEFNPVIEDISEDSKGYIKKYEDKTGVWYAVDKGNLVVDERISMAKITNEEFEELLKVSMEGDQTEDE